MCWWCRQIFLFFHFYFGLICFGDAVNTSSTIQELLIILEHPKLINVNEKKRSIDISVELCFEWDFKNSKRKPENGEVNSKSFNYWNEEDSFGIITENVIDTRSSKNLQTKTLLVQSMRSTRQLSILSEVGMNLASFPNDQHIFQLRFTSAIQNSSELVLNPHFVASPEDGRGTSEWMFEISKSYVQWVVHNNESFEQAVFELRITRIPPISAYISIFSMFLVNIIVIFRLFPVFETGSKRENTEMLFVCQVLIFIFFSSLNGFSKRLTVFDHHLMFLLGLTITAEIVQKVLPFLIYHLHCCPIEADPSPPKYPSPSDQFSLDTERSKCNAALDSARAESIKSPRVANFDMCLAEVKFTMVSFNEVLNLHSSAEWRKKLWRNAYYRFEVISFIIFQVINIILFTTFC